MDNDRSERVVSIGLQILEGLAAAHKSGIVHRDIKPANVILADDGRVRILDFGLAKLAGGVDITKDGATSGTAAYMSPEQVNSADVGLDHVVGIDVPPTFMDRYEVTNRRFREFVNAGGYRERSFWKHPFMNGNVELSFGDAMALFTDRSGRHGPATWESGTYPDGQEEYPVSGVSWYEAAAYAEFAGRELPTMFHWNKAAQTWTTAAVVPGSNFSLEGPEPVGSGSMSAFGTYDLAGNVREWLASGTSDDKRYLMGGAWNDVAYLATDAFAHNPLDRSVTNGFRTILYLEEPANRDSLMATLDAPKRDFRSEEPVSDTEYATILRMYAYDKTPLNAEIEYTDNSNPEWILQRVSFDAAYGGERVVAKVYLPRTGTPPYQTLIYYPGSDSIQRKVFEDDTRTRAFDWLVRDGRAVIFPAYKGTYERNDGLDSYVPKETIFYRDHIIMAAKDLRRAVDYVEEREDLDGDRVAYIGWSWGGMLGPLMTAVEPRFKANVFAVAGLMNYPTFPEVEPFNFLPRVAAPTLMLNGRYDYYFPFDVSQQPFFETLGLPDDRKHMVVSDVGHSVPRDLLLKEGYAWLDRWLGPVE